MRQIKKWIALITVTAILAGVSSFAAGGPEQDGKDSAAGYAAGEGAPEQEDALVFSYQGKTITEFDFGDMVQGDLYLDKGKRPKIQLTNNTGEKIVDFDVTPRLPEQANPPEERAKYFVMSGPGVSVGGASEHFIDASGTYRTVDYTLYPISRDGVFPLGETTETFTATGRTQKTNKTVQAQITVRVCVIPKGGSSENSQYLKKLTALNGVLWFEMEPGKAYTADDFTISAQVNGVSTPLNPTDFVYDADKNSIRILYDKVAPVEEIAQVVRITVLHKGDKDSLSDAFTVDPLGNHSTIPADGKVTVVVVDGQGRPLPGVQVRLSPYSGGTPVVAETDADGNAALQLDPHMTYLLACTYEGYADFEFPTPDFSTSVFQVQMSRDEGSSGQSAPIVIAVVDEQGAPISGADVSVHCPTDASTVRGVTANSGRCEFSGRANSYRVTVSKSGYFTQSQAFSTAGVEKELRIVLREKNLCAVRVKVQDERGNPLSGAYAHFICPIDNALGEAYSGSDGVAGPVTIRGNVYVLTVTRTGYETFEQQLTIDKDQTISVTLKPVAAVDPGHSSSGSSGSNQSYAEKVQGAAGSSAGTAAQRGKPVDAVSVARQVSEKLRASLAEGKLGKAAVVVKNATRVSPETLRAMAATAEASKGKCQLLADSLTPDGKIAARLTIDAEAGQSLKQDISLQVSVDSAQTERTKKLFEKYYDNTFAAIHFEQSGSFGMDVQAAVKVSLDGMDTKNLKFYTYDSKTNRYAPIPSDGYFIDANGYLHFTTSVGGEILITDQELKKRQ